MERLSGLDSAFLSFETPSMHLHVALVAVVDPSTMPEPYRFDRLKEFIVGRLRQMPAARRRAVAVPFGINHPLWVEDPDIDFDFHVRRHALPTPGGRAELEELTGVIAGMPLDRTRPLWEIHVIEGLREGHIALLGKIHHAAVDGVSGAELFVHLFDLTPEPEPREGPEEVEAERIPSDVEMVTYAVISQVRRTVGLPALVGRTARTLSMLVNRHRDDEVPTGGVPLKAPRVPWSAAITPHRSVAFTRVPLAEVKAVKNAFGVKVNDVVLALVGLATRRYLLDRHALPDTPLLAMCPVSVRTEDTRGRFDNQVSPMWVALHTEVDDPGDLLRAVARATQGAKEDHNAIGARFLQDWTEHAAPSTFALAARVYSRLNLADRHRPIYNLTVSNVPGPTSPLYLSGAELVAAYPMGPISEGAGLNVTVLSYRDHLDVGFLAARELVPRLHEMADHIDGAMAALLTAAALPRHPHPAPAPAGGSPAPAGGTVSSGGSAAGGPGPAAGTEPAAAGPRKGSGGSGGRAKPGGRPAKGAARPRPSTTSDGPRPT